VTGGWKDSISVCKLKAILWFGFSYNNSLNSYLLIYSIFSARASIISECSIQRKEATPILIL
jgi:hypothetical protein